MNLNSVRQGFNGQFLKEHQNLTIKNQIQSGIENDELNGLDQANRLVSAGMIVYYFQIIFLISFILRNR